MCIFILYLPLSSIHYFRYIWESIECRHMVFSKKVLKIYRRIVKSNNIDGIRFENTNDIHRPRMRLKMPK